MQKIKAKFVCTEVEDQPTFKQKAVTFSPVVSGSEENMSFSKYTPGGVLLLTISYDTKASDAFEKGKEYFLDIYAADGPAVSDLVSFGKALEAIKQGKRVAREGWNGKGMFIFMRPADDLHIDMVVNKVKSLPQSVKDYYRQDLIVDGAEEAAENRPADDTVKFTAYLCMKAADGTVVNGWLASQTDMLSEDWVILD